MRGRQGSRKGWMDGWREIWGVRERAEGQREESDGGSGERRRGCRQVEETD